MYMVCADCMDTRHWHGRPHKTDRRAATPLTGGKETHYYVRTCTCTSVRKTLLHEVLCPALSLISAHCKTNNGARRCNHFLYHLCRRRTEVCARVPGRHGRGQARTTRLFAADSGSPASSDPRMENLWTGIAPHGATLLAAILFRQFTCLGRLSRHGG